MLRQCQGHFGGRHLRIEQTVRTTCVLAQVTKLDNDSSSLTARPSAGNMTKAAAKPPTRYQAREDDFYVSFIKQACSVAR